MLSVSELDAFYGDSQVLFDVDMETHEEEVVGIFGRNGMGKTTLFRSIVNQVNHTGTIRFDGSDISSLNTYQIARRGIAYVPEERDIYPDLTVTENIELAAARERDEAELDSRLEQIFDLFPNLAEKSNLHGGALSGGEQQMLAVARVLITQPDILLLDEPTEGLAPVIIDSLMEALAQLAKEGQTIILVEQNINRTLSLVDRGYFLENGTVVMEGESDELGDEALQQEYLSV